jgi:prohibitin 2
VAKDPIIIDVPAEAPPPRPPRWDDRVYAWWMPRWRKIRGPFWVLFFIALFLFAWLYDRIFVNIYPGYNGVMWRRFTVGTDYSEVFGSGFWVVNPFNKMYIYETRMQQRETNFTALTSNGLIIMIRASVRFRPERKDLPRLHEELGPEYVDRVVIPQVQSVIRKIMGAYEPEQIYGTQGNILQNVVLTAMGELRARYIEMDDLLIREIVLPTKVANAIENKLEQEQLAAQYVYILQRERQEKERKIIEAEGIQAFQRTVSKDLDENYLRLKGIAATVELATSANAKVVVFGNNPSGLPLILNTGDSLNLPSTRAPAKPTVPAATPPSSSGTPAPANPLSVPPATDLPRTDQPSSKPPPSEAPPVPPDVTRVPAEVSQPAAAR